MRRSTSRLALAAAALAALLGAAAPAHAESVFVQALTDRFSPRELNVLTGDTVVWRNVSQKTHNVAFETEGFDSGRIAPRGAANHPFTVDGTYAYVCTIHDGMTGQVGVHPLVLEGPVKRVRRGGTIAFGVRAPEGATGVTIEASRGADWVPVAAAGPLAAGEGHGGHDDPGMLHANVTASESATYRAAFAGGTSNELSVEVTDAPDVAVSARGAGRGRSLVRVKADPAAPGARVVLQLRLRERFGWWPVARARLDRRSRASFTIRGRRGTRARAVLVGPDWSTPISRSRTTKLPR